MAHGTLSERDIKIAQVLRPLPAPKANPVKKIVPAKKTTAKPNAVTKALAKTAVKSAGSPAPADAIQHVFRTRRDANAGGVKAPQLSG